jgi:hypothetical protein
MKPPVIIQTCDRYKPYWGGFLHFMERHWDFSIGSKIFLCNEEEDFDLPDWCEQIKTGSGSFVQNLRKSVEQVGSDEVFLMLEDFWPIAPMSSLVFEELLLEFRSKNLDALQVSNYTPYYTLKASNTTVAGKKMMEFDPLSEWVFNFQARFWRAEKLLKFLVEPAMSEREANSAITVEIASDKKARAEGGLSAELYHYTWYPISGVAHRGVFTEFGKHLANIFNIDKHVEAVFS